MVQICAATKIRVPRGKRGPVKTLYRPPRVPINFVTSETLTVHTHVKQ